MIDRLYELRATGVVAVLRAPSADHAVNAADALIAGGVSGIEVTYTTPDAPAAIREIAARHPDGVFLGAGTITRPDQAGEAVRAGARFLVSPGSTPDVANAMRATGVPMLLGAITPTEVMTALDLGADAIKLFPASLGGPALLKALHGPFPGTPIVPTGGVTVDNLAAWMAAGATAVGGGGELAPTSAILAGDWELLTRSAVQFIGAWHRATAVTR